MKKRIIITAYYTGIAKDVFNEAIQLQELKDAMKGLAEYEGIPDVPLKEGETITADVTVWKIFKTKGYEMYIERLDKEACVLESQEKGGVIRSWEHRISITQDGEKAIWTDDITLDAGIMTPIMARYGIYMYRRRHRYRQSSNITSKITSKITSPK